MNRVVKSLLVGALAAGIGLAAMPVPAGAALATVGNGLVTTDLSAVGMSPDSLAATLVGPGVSVSNVVYTGANAQAGLIHLVDPAVVSFNDGVIFSSGNIADVVGPNKSDGITGDMAGPDDADLNALIANSQTVNPITFDAAKLEFDFVPTASTVYFTYTFASDEYLEWVNLFNDVFAFYVNGQNCATVPNGDPVSIDTINSAVNPDLFRDNSFSSPPANPINIESDGLSVEMICSASVNAGQTNHMKLAIADTSDQILDSVVMIKAQSLSVTKPESCNDGVDNDDDTLIDGSDDSCSSTTTPPPTGSSGIGSSGNPPAFTGNEGTPIPLDASALGWVPTLDTISTAWTVTGINGTPGTCEVSPAGSLPIGPGNTIAVVSAVCPNEGEYVASVAGTDAEGKSSFDYDVDFFVHNAPPAVAIDTPIAGTQATVGTPIDVSATVTDPGVDDTVTCEITWGDGTAEPGTIAAGACIGTHTYGAVGSQVLSVTATDNAADSAAVATIVPVVAGEVTVAPSITTQPVAASVVGGQPFEFTAAADGLPTPTVQWQQSDDAGATWIDVAGATTTTLSGTASLGMNGFQHRAVFTNSTGTAITDAATLTVVQTSVALATSTATSVSGQAVVLTASIADASTPSASLGGRVTFYDGPTVLATKLVNAGTAVLTTTKLGLGPHGITAVYKRTSASSPVSSSAVAVVVQQPSTQVVLTGSPLTTTSTRIVTLRAKVTVVLPGKGKVVPGTVTFYDGATPIATVVLTTAAATFKSTFAAGVHTITAVYNGSGTLLASPSSNPLVVTTT